MTLKRIGIFGGTFDPIHNGHLQAAHGVMRRMALDRIFFVPAGIPPHKPEGVTGNAADRLEMVRRAIAGQAHFDLCDREVRNRGKSYAVETSQDFRERYPEAELFLVMGLDAFLDLGTWRSVDRLITLCHFIVISRRGFSFRQATTLEWPVDLDPSILQDLDTGQHGQAEIPEISMTAHTRLYLLNLPPCDISATAVRECLHARQDPKKFLPESVRFYIMQNGIYRGGRD